MIWSRGFVRLVGISRFFLCFRACDDKLPRIRDSAATLSVQNLINILLDLDKLDIVIFVVNRIFFCLNDQNKILFCSLSLWNFKIVVKSSIGMVGMLDDYLMAGSNKSKEFEILILPHTYTTLLISLSDISSVAI